jgi:hypothetical protein
MESASYELRSKSTRRRAQLIFIGMPTLSVNKHVVNQKLEHFSEIFGRISGKITL